MVHNHINNIIAKINYIGLLIELKKVDAAVVEFSVACKLVLNTYGVLYSQIEGTKAYRKHREYIALLVLIKNGHVLEQEELIGQLIKDVPITALSEHVHQFNNNIYPKDVFSNTCIIHGNIITLTR